MTEQVEQRICIKFCIKLDHSSMESIWMIQKAIAVGNWWLTASISFSGLTTRASRLMPSCLMKHLITQITQCPYSPDLVPCDFSFFSKLKSPLKGERFQTTSEIQENTTGQLMMIGRTVWGPKVPTLKGTEVSLSDAQCFLYLVSSLINASIFHSIWLHTFWTGPINYGNCFFALCLWAYKRFHNTTQLSDKGVSYKQNLICWETFILV